jgi:hypothetical protein
MGREYVRANKDKMWEMRKTACPLPGREGYGNRPDSIDDEPAQITHVEALEPDS